MRLRFRMGESTPQPPSPSQAEDNDEDGSDAMTSSLSEGQDWSSAVEEDSGSDWENTRPRTSSSHRLCQFVM
jgi:hypothetical protein